MTGVVFVDTNILIYAHDRDAVDKRRHAAVALDRLWNERSGRVSVQVLQEFYVTVTKKLSTPLARIAAREVIRIMLAAAGCQHDHRRAIVSQRLRLRTRDLQPQPDCYNSLTSA